MFWFNLKYNLQFTQNKKQTHVYFHIISEFNIKFRQLPGDLSLLEKDIYIFLYALMLMQSYTERQLFCSGINCIKLKMNRF